MKICVASMDGAGLSWIPRLQQEGHTVLLWDLKKSFSEHIGEGIVKSTTTYMAVRAFKPDFIVFDSSGGGKIAEQVSNQFPTYGSSSLHDELELDRDNSLQLCKLNGIKVSNMYSTKNYSDAISYVRKHKEAVALKLSGLKYAGSSATYVSREPDDAIVMLELYKDKFKNVDIVVQDKVNGIEIATAGFFDGEKFLPTFYHTLERKKAFDGDLGPSVGCAGDVVWNTTENHIVRQGLMKLSKSLKDLNYYGEIDLNSIVDEKGNVWALELTPRFGYNASLSWFTTLNMDLSDLLCQLANRKAKNIKTKSGYGTSTTVYIPPFPSSKTSLMEAGVPILGLEKDDLVWFCPMSVKRTSNIVTSIKSDGWIGSPCTYGTNMWAAIEENYARIKKLIIPNVGYRTDIGVDAEKSLKGLKKWL